MYTMIAVIQERVKKRYISELHNNKKNQQKTNSE